MKLQEKITKESSGISSNDISGMSPWVFSFISVHSIDTSSFVASSNGTQQSTLAVKSSVFDGIPLGDML